MILKNELSKLGIFITDYVKLNSGLYEIYDGDNKYILKRVEDNGVYEFFQTQNVNSVLYPLNINGVTKIKINNKDYYIFNYLSEVKYPEKNKVYDLMNALQEIHTSTIIQKKMYPELDIPRFKKMYQFLKGKFEEIDNFLRLIESKEYYSDIDFMILNRYYTILDIKYYLNKLQTKILDKMESGLEPKICLNHGNPDLNHLINKKLISFNKAKMTIPVYDIALFYINTAEIRMNHRKIILDWLNQYEDQFYYLYFKFLVLYIYVYNLSIKSETSYIETSNKIDDFIQIFLTEQNSDNQ